AAAARSANRLVALTLSDPFCVDRHREEFRDLVADEIDVLFANEAEICSLYEVDDFDAALEQVRRHCRVGALTRSEQGSVAIGGDEAHVIGADPVDRLVYTRGAGDQSAAGFLYGLTHRPALATFG